MKSQMKVSIVVPVYNERNTIKAVIDRLLALDLEKEILVVDDGSSDGSAGILREQVEGLAGVRVFYQNPNQGKGAALRRGFQEARGEVLIIQDADLELDPRDILKVAAPVLEGRALAVYGSRFLAARPRYFALTYWANGFLTLLTNWLYGARITDMETCYKCFRRDVLARFQIDSDRFDFEPEITAKLLRLGIGIEEVPISYEPRSRAQGKKIGWRDGLKAVSTLLRYRKWSAPS